MELERAMMILANIVSYYRAQLYISLRADWKLDERGQTLADFYIIRVGISYSTVKKYMQVNYY
jgi:hypothetical protein